MLIGHQRIWNFLIKSVSRERLAHAYLFCGPEQVGKATLAKEFAKWLFCEQKKKDQDPPCGKCRSCLDLDKDQHPDLFIIKANESEESLTEIGIEKIRALQRQLLFYPYKSSFKIVIIEEAHRLTAEAANAFLKTLEEPGPNSIIILTSSSLGLILPTIFSRCQVIRFFSVPFKQMEEGLRKEKGKFSDLDRVLELSAGRPGYAKRLINDKKFLLENEGGKKQLEDILKSDLVFRFEIAKDLSQNIPLARQLLSLWALCLRDQLLRASKQRNSPARGDILDDYFGQSPAPLSKVCREIERARSLLQNSSFNARLILETFLMKV
jgi:DNA polymerase-3 subunit delta'